MFIHRILFFIIVDTWNISPCYSVVNVFQLFVGVGVGMGVGKEKDGDSG